MDEEKKTYLKKVKSDSVVQQVVNSLTDAMLHRQLKPGDKLPTEAELAESLGVGRNSVREAVKILTYMGVLEIRRAEGTFVCEGFSESMIDPMIYGIILDKEDSYENLLELRELMEVGVMYLAMQKASDDDIRQLKKKLDVMEREIAAGVENLGAVFEADNQFHATISLMGKNPLVHKINKVVLVLVQSMRYYSVKGMLEMGRGQELFEAHQRLYQILAEKNMTDMNEAVRKTYFTEATMRQSDDFE